MAEIRDILVRYANRETLNENEAGLLAEWLHNTDAASFHELAAEIMDVQSMPEQARISLEARLDALKDEEVPTSVHRIHFLRLGWRKFAAAAVLLLIAGVAYFYIFSTGKQAQTIAYKTDVAPGKEGAKLKLSDGRVIMIDTLKDGMIAMDGKLKVLKKNGKIVYEGSTDEIVYNEIIADRGRQSSAILPDGSTVYLNAASSLRYPLHFTGDTRNITMTGEVYFEVAHNANMPFIVTTGSQEIKVLGTRFNVKAYNDEPVFTTTLLEGSIQIRNKRSDKIIKPGQQAITSEKNSGIELSDANTEEAVAWLKGKFKFNNTDLHTTMRQLARWYDVTVKYENGVTDSHFFGGTQMSGNLSEVLKVLELSGLHFKIEDRTIIVYP
jgi:transmembrane sensor